MTHTTKRRDAGEGTLVMMNWLFKVSSCPAIQYVSCLFCFFFLLSLHIWIPVSNDGLYQGGIATGLGVAALSRWGMK